MKPSPRETGAHSSGTCWPLQRIAIVSMSHIDPTAEREARVSEHSALSCFGVILIELWRTVISSSPLRSLIIVQEWIEAIVGKEFPDTFAESLKDGVILCK